MMVVIMMIGAVITMRITTMVFQYASQVLQLRFQGGTLAGCAPS